MAEILGGVVLLPSDISEVRLDGILLLVNAAYLFFTRPKNNVLPFRKDK